MTDPLEKEIQKAKVLEVAESEETDETESEETETMEDSVSEEIGNRQAEIGNREPESGNRQPESAAPESAPEPAPKPKRARQWRKVYKRKSDIRKSESAIPPHEKRHRMDAESRSIFETLLRRERERKER